MRCACGVLSAVVSSAPWTSAENVDDEAGAISAADALDTDALDHEPNRCHGSMTGSQCPLLALKCDAWSTKAMWAMPESMPSAVPPSSIVISEIETSRASPSAPSMRISIRCTPASYSGMSASSASSTTCTQMPPSHTTSSLSAGNATSWGSSASPGVSSSASPGVSACAIISSRSTESEKARIGGGSGSESERSVRPMKRRGGRPNRGDSGGPPEEAP